MDYEYSVSSLTPIFCPIKNENVCFYIHLRSILEQNIVDHNYISVYWEMLQDFRVGVILMIMNSNFSHCHFRTTYQTTLANTFPLLKRFLRNFGGYLTAAILCTSTKKVCDFFVFCPSNLIVSGLQL